MRLGYEITVEKDEIIIQRTTKETKIKVIVSQRKNKKPSIQTSFQFLNHMIDTISWRANLNIGIQVESEIKLSHTLSEDAGITIGRAILELYKSKIVEGVEGYGYARGILDEACADVALSIEGRVNYVINGPDFEKVEDVSGYDLIAFLEGFCQGCKCTLRTDFTGKDPHHTWEAVFRALGIAIKNTLESNIWRKKSISGIKGTID